MRKQLLCSASSASLFFFLAAASAQEADGDQETSVAQESGKDEKPSAGVSLSADAEASASPPAQEPQTASDVEASASPPAQEPQTASDAEASASPPAQEPQTASDAPAYGAALPPPPGDPDPHSGEDSYMDAFVPEDQTWQVGVGIGGLFPSPGLQLIGGGQPELNYGTAAFEFAGRIAYYPKAFLGVEGEVVAGLGHVNSFGAAINAYRAHLIGQIPKWSIVPFVLAGVGGLGAASQPLGHDIDFTVHVGAGVKLAVVRDIALRLDLRENMTKRTDDSYAGTSFNEEIMFGAEFTIGRPEEVYEVPPEPPDADGDHTPDFRDSCPQVPALSEDGCPADSDHDGIADPDDLCPYEAGASEKGCPDPDPDEDGVVLPCDICPKEKGTPPDGCPVRDSDGDGFLDDEDECVNEPETKNGFEDDDGCPDEVPKEVEKFTGAIEGIQFFQGSAKIRATSEKKLQEAVDVLAKFPSVRLEITGHTSSEGDDEFNQKLSEDRAQAVVDWLVERGVSRDRLKARGAGSSEPVADNDTALGRTQNRRIEFKILKR